MNTPTSVIEVLYFEEDGVFTWDDGTYVENIYDLITPNQLYLFWHDKGKCVFPYRQNEEAAVIILEYPDETCGSYFFGEENYNDQECCYTSSSICYGCECGFSISDPSAKEEICKYCRGG